MEMFAPRFRHNTELRQMGLRCGDNCMVSIWAVLVGTDQIELGDNVRIDPFCIISAVSGHVKIGSYVHIAAQACIYGAGGVTMEDFSGLSHGVKVYSCSDDYSGASLTNPTIPRDFQKVVSKPIHIGRHVIVGSGSVILPGANIGEGSAVGALSLVTKPLEPWGIYSGVPAKRIRARKKELLKGEAALMQGHAATDLITA